LDVLQQLIEDNVDHERAREAALLAAARFSWHTFALDLAAQL